MHRTENYPTQLSFMRGEKHPPEKHQWQKRTLHGEESRLYKPKLERADTVYSERNI